MKTVKTAVSAVLLASLLAVAALPVCADGDQSLTLTMQQDSDYILSIPRDQSRITFGAVDTVIGDLCVTGNIQTIESVIVTMSYTDFIDVNDEANYFSYTMLMDDGSEFESATWTSSMLLSDEYTGIPLTVHIDTSTWAVTEAGTYNSNLIFTAQLV